jgi:O-antigen/teichoic acid export membrane protein
VIFTGHERTVNVKKNIMASFFVRGIAIITGFISVPLTLGYINNTEYGIWITMNTLVAWFSYFDIGIGNGLKNKLIVAFANKNLSLARQYISTAYFFIFLIVLLFIAIFYSVVHFISFEKLLNIQSSTGMKLGTVMAIIFFTFCIQFLLNLINTILFAEQHQYLSSPFDIAGNILNLLLIYILIKTTQGSLVLLALSMAFKTLLVFSISNIYFFKTRYRALVPSIKYFNFALRKDLLSLGIKFFVIQISFVIIYQTTNIMISNLFGPEEVTPYSISYKLFSIIPMLFFIICSPFWTAFGDSYAKKDFQWIKRSISKLNQVWLLFALINTVLLIFSNFIFKIWIGNKVHIPFIISLIISANNIVTIWLTIYVNFINGTGKVHLQFLIAIISCVLFIPCAYYLAKSLNLGIIGLLLTSLIFNLLAIIYIPLQYKKLMTENAKGIWLK